MVFVSDTARDIDKVGEDTVFCGLVDVEDAGELVLDGVRVLDAELSVRSLSCPVRLDWLSTSGLLLDIGEELEFVGIVCLISGVVHVLGSPSGTIGVWLPS